MGGQEDSIMDVAGNLLRLFGENRVDEIEDNSGQMLKDAFGSAQYENLIEDRDFNKLYTQFVEQKRYVEEIWDKYEGNDEDQIRECLCLVRDAKEKEGAEVLEVLQGLIKESLYRNWTDDQRAIYDSKYKIIVDWKDYFISYTNRDAADTNDDFKRLIKSVYSAMPRIGMRVEENFVAKIIVKYLEGNDLRGFFDHNNIKCGDDIEDEIREFCQKSCVFVQLIEPIIFSRPRGKRNWCFEEYNEFNSMSKILEQVYGKHFDLCHQFIITEDKVSVLRPANLHQDYSSWYNHVGRTKYKRLKYGGSRYRNAQIIDKQQLRREVGEIAIRIIEVRNKIIDTILGY